MSIQRFIVSGFLYPRENGDVVRYCDVEKLKAQLDKLRWIPVEERLPERKKKDSGISRPVEVVNGTAERREIWTTLYCYENKSWADTAFKPHPSHITHWRLIILPVKETEKVKP